MAQTVPQSASSYSRAQRAEMAAALSSVSRLWRRMGDDFDASYAAIELPLLTVVYTAQGRVAAGAQAYVPRVMAEVGLDVREPAFETFPEAWAGTAGDGRQVSGLAYQSVVKAKQAVAGGASPALALQSAGGFLTAAMGGVLSDTARGVEKVGGNARGVRTYVRMLTPPSCGRCVILAGQTYGASEAFDRHPPTCDCRNIPAPENAAGDFTTDPAEYLDSLSDEELARTLGSKANAEAYRMGADQNQLINAYRRGGDVRPAQVYGRRVKYTTEGTTRRGLAYHRMAQADYVKAQGERRMGSKYFRLKAPRLMPESIFKIAGTDQAEARRLLRLYGWI